MSRLNRLRTLGGLRGRALSGSDSIGNGLRADVVAYYKLGDVSDSGPNGYTLTNNNAVTFGAGKVGNAATFASASNQSLSRAGSDIDITTTDFAFSWWMKTATTGRWVFTKGGTSANGYQCYIDGTNIYWYLKTDSGTADFTASGATLTDNSWHHVAVTGDRDGVLTVYVDNVSMGTLDISSRSQSLATASAFMLGDHVTTSGIEYNGSLDEFGFWRRLLTAGEIAYLYASGSGIALY